jgi:hypothetical protein
MSQAEPTNLRRNESKPLSTTAEHAEHAEGEVEAAVLFRVFRGGFRTAFELLSDFG